MIFFGRQCLAKRSRITLILILLIHTCYWLAIKATYEYTTHSNLDDKPDIINTLQDNVASGGVYRLITSRKLCGGHCQDKTSQNTILCQAYLTCWALPANTKRTHTHNRDSHPNLDANHTRTVDGQCRSMETLGELSQSEFVASEVRGLTTAFNKRELKKSDIQSSPALKAG